jgi:hypothetical protein
VERVKVITDLSEFARLPVPGRILLPDVPGERSRTGRTCGQGGHGKVLATANDTSCASNYFHRTKSGSQPKVRPRLWVSKPAIPFRGLAWRILQAEAGARKLR